MYTGDEMGFMIRWDISRLLEKLDTLRPKELVDSQHTGKQKLQKGKTTFLTGFHDEVAKM